MSIESFDVISPIDGQVLDSFAYSTDAEIAAALTNISHVQKKWQATPLSERAEICRRALAYFETNKADIAREITQQMGRPIQYTPGEVAGLQERGHYMIDIAAAQLADVAVPEQPGFKRYIRREPVGTVFVIAPWNYPYLTAVNTIIPALIAGNTVLLKHSAQTPLCAERFLEAFTSAGLPKGIFQTLKLTHDQIAKLIQSPSINYVAFTGSVNGGAAIEQAASGRFIGVGLELGGKDPAYVRADANLEHAVANLVDGAFFNSGQSCCGIERIYVHQSCYDAFVEAFVELTKQYVVGNPLTPTSTLGPVVSTQAARSIQEQVDSAVNAGAQLCIAGNHFASQLVGLGDSYLAPQVLTQVNHDMALMREETFGPVVGIMSVLDDNEAIRLMNDSEFGLTASLWSMDVDTCELLGRQINTGTVFQNRCDYLDPALAWTGVKNTGRGITLSELGYHGLTQAKSFHLRSDI